MLPDNTSFKTVLDFGDISSVGDLVTVLCAKTGLKPADDYDLVDLRSDNSGLICLVGSFDMSV